LIFCLAGPLDERKKYGRSEYEQQRTNPDITDFELRRSSRRALPAIPDGVSVLNEHHTAAASPAPITLLPLLSDKELACILVMTLPWVRTHAPEIPGFERLGMYFRFRTKVVEQWLGSLDRLLKAGAVASLLKVPKSWVYTNADEIPGVLRLGGYIRFRPAAIERFLGGSELVQ
jgi:hypothetical protein